MMIRQFLLVPPTIMLTMWGRAHLKMVFNLKIEFEKSETNLIQSLKS